MKKKKKAGNAVKIIVILVVAAVIVLAVAKKTGILQKTDGGSSSQTSALMQVKTSETQVTRGTIEVTTQGDGVIEAAEKNIVTADYALLVRHVDAENGDYLEEGDVIAQLDPDSIDDQIDAYQEQLSSVNQSISGASDEGSSSLTAPVSGRIKKIFAKEGDLLSDVQTEYGGIAEIAADGNLKVVFTSDADVRTGDKVTVIILNYEEEGYISEVDNGTCTAVIDDSENYQADQAVTVEDEDRNVLGSGVLESNYPFLVEGNYGMVDELEVDVNDYVSAGDTILTRTHTTYNASYLSLLESRNDLMEKLKELRQLKEDPEIRAQGEGILTDLTLTNGMMTTAQGAMYTLISTDTFDLKADIDELDIAGVQPGQTATVVFDAFEDKEYEGTVTKVSRLGNNKGGVTTFTVTVQIPGSEELKTNMSATVTIVTDQAEDVLMVPVDAVQTMNDKKYVTVISGDSTQDREVTLGLVNNTMAQITDGLSEGESVVVIGTSEMEDMMNMMRASSSAMSSSSGGDQ